jgi:peptide/nickel transport system substrate-binding protein
MLPYLRFSLEIVDSMNQKLIVIGIVALLGFSACQVSTPPAAAQPAEVHANSSPKTLTICMGTEPQSLYPYAASSQSARDILQAIYDGPFDEIDGKATPVILTAMPTYADGSAVLTPVNVQQGDEVVDIYGQLVSLDKGTQVFPSGCSSSACAVTWDGITALQMDQPSAAFHLKSGLTWSDGQALTASDSVYSYTLAADANTPVDKTYVDQTASYTASDDAAIQWVGKPGLVTDAFEHYFWMPLPQHAWGSISAAGLLTDEAATRNPVGYGAYMIDEWSSGQYLRLKKNPYYFRASEGLPKFDYLVFKFTDPNGDTNLSNLKFEREPFLQFRFDVGEFTDEVDQNGCDLTSTTADMSDQLSVLNILRNYYQDPAVKVMEGLGKHVTWLVFNLKKTAQPLLNDVKIRQALSLCLDREKLDKEVFFNNYPLPDRISFSYESAAGAANAALQYDAAQAQAILTELGWVEQGQDLPRISRGVEGVPDGTYLSLTYLTLNDAQNLAVANQVKTSLEVCGAQVNVQAVPAETFWSRTSEDSIFKGNFDLAQIEWALPINNPCPLFASAGIPDANNDFNGLNFSGFFNEQFDGLCSQYPLMQFSDEKQALLDQMAAILNDNLPVIPIYARADLMVARNDFCDTPTGIGVQSELFAIEDFKYDPDCRE